MVQNINESKEAAKLLASLGSNKELSLDQILFHLTKSMESKHSESNNDHDEHDHSLNNELTLAEYNEKVDEFFQDREDYLETGDKDIFNEYLPRRASLGEDTEEYDKMVQLIIDNTDMKMSEDTFEAQTPWEEVEGKQEMGDFFKYLTAAAIVDNINRPDLIEAMVSGPNELKIGMFTRAEDSNVAGKYSIDGTLMVDVQEHVNGFIFNDDSYNTIQHEAIHRLDHVLGHEEGDRFTDGILEAMTPEDLALFEHGKDLLAKKQEAGGTDLPEYAFSDIEDGGHEFLAVAIEMLENPEGLLAEGEGGQAIYTALANTFNIDPLSYNKENKENSEDFAIA